MTFPARSPRAGLPAGRRSEGSGVGREPRLPRFLAYGLGMTVPALSPRACLPAGRRSEGSGVGREPRLPRFLAYGLGMTVPALSPRACLPAGRRSEGSGVGREPRLPRFLAYGLGMTVPALSPRACLPAGRRSEGSGVGRPSPPLKSLRCRVVAPVPRFLAALGMTCPLGWQIWPSVPYNAVRPACRQAGPEEGSCTLGELPLAGLLPL